MVRGRALVSWGQPSAPRGSSDAISPAKRSRRPVQETCAERRQAPHVVAICIDSVPARRLAIQSWIGKTGRCGSDSERPEFAAGASRRPIVGSASDVRFERDRPPGGKKTYLVRSFAQREGKGCPEYAPTGARTARWSESTGGGHPSAGPASVGDATIDWERGFWGAWWSLPWHFRLGQAQLSYRIGRT
jgi:hypothetical protein